MQTAEHIDYITVEEYLAAETQSEIRHEYLGGLVYAMAGETRAHNQVVGNLFVHLRQRLHGGPCKLYVSDIRVNFRLKDDDYFYYPDLVVTCDPRDTHPRFIHYPKVIIEVLSPGTERVDRREKFFAYNTVESLEEYVLIAQEEREATVFRRANNWKAEKISGPEVAFASLSLMLPFDGIYEGI